MRVQVLLFASARERAGASRVEVELDDPATIAALKEALGRDVPALGRLIPAMRFAIDGEYAADDHQPIPPGAEVAAIPPVSGGAPSTHFASTSALHECT